jgi:hypothetical protein
MVWIYFLVKDGVTSFGFAVILVWVGLLCSVWSDWILAAIANNWGGLPSGDIAFLFWIYFIAKRLPMFSVQNFLGKPLHLPLLELKMS